MVYLKKTQTEVFARNLVQVEIKKRFATKQRFYSSTTCDKLFSGAIGFQTRNKLSLKSDIIIV